jgi:hypothetical protein
LKKEYKTVKLKKKNKKKKKKSMYSLYRVPRFDPWSGTENPNLDDLESQLRVRMPQLKVPDAPNKDPTCHNQIFHMLQLNN